MGKGATNRTRSARFLLRSPNMQRLAMPVLETNAPNTKRAQAQAASV